MRAYSYLRFSTGKQSKGDSDSRQTAGAAKWATANGYTLDKETIADRGVSAFRGKNAERGAMGEFLAKVKAGQIPKGSVLNDVQTFTLPDSTEHIPWASIVGNHELDPLDPTVTLVVTAGNLDPLL